MAMWNQYIARPDGSTAVMDVAENGNVECIRTLIEGGANVNYANTNGKTALMVAGWNVHVEAIKALIEAGADVNQARTDGRKAGETALMSAAEKGYLLFFMKSYAKRKFALPDDVPENVLVNSAFILLLQLLDTDMCINRVTNICSITQEHINQILSDPLIDLSGRFAFTSNEITLEMNSVEIIYKHLLVDAFDAIYKSNKKKEMIDIINKWSIDTKRKMLMHIFKKSNTDKLKTILTNTMRQDWQANQKRRALKEMVRLLLVDGVYIDRFKELQIVKELIYKIFENELLNDDFIIRLHNQGWSLN
jgi:hypothetical protein